MGMSFTKFNETLNYYSKTSRTTGENVWEQDKVQQDFVELIGNCNLTKEQLDSIGCFMVSNNATIDGKQTQNASVIEFEKFMSESKEISAQKSI